jgi:hypothetical protein
MTERAPDRVSLQGASGHPCSGMLKVSIGYIDSYIGEGQISYAGPGALARARLAQAIVAERFALTGVALTEVRYDLIGVNALHGDREGPLEAEPREVRLRVIGRTVSLQQAIRIGNEVETLYTCGPAGGGGATRSAREVIAIRSTLLPAAQVSPVIHFEET